MVGAPVLRVEQSGGLKLFDRDFRIAQAPERPTHRHPKPGFDQWLVR
jgi:hypothetical protein